MRSEVAAEAGARRQLAAGKRPPRHHDRPEEGGEEKAPGEEGDGIAAAHDVLAEQHVERVGERAAQREQDSGARQSLAAAEDVDDQAEARQRERERQPDTPPHMRVLHEPRPQGDEERREVLDQQGDPDREPVDRQEVEELHEREAAHSEGHEVGQLAPRQEIVFDIGRME